MAEGLEQQSEQEESCDQGDEEPTEGGMSVIGSKDPSGQESELS